MDSFFIEHIVGLSWDMSQIMRFSLQFQGFHRVSPSDCTMAPAQVARALPSGRQRAARCLGTALSTSLVLGFGLTLLCPGNVEGTMNGEVG
jgi:hypothetical protein